MLSWRVRGAGALETATRSRLAERGVDRPRERVEEGVRGGEEGSRSWRAAASSPGGPRPGGEGGVRAGPAPSSGGGTASGRVENEGRERSWFPPVRSLFHDKAAGEIWFGRTWAIIR
jgi:hypothetical protein